MYRFKAIVMQ